MPATPPSERSRALQLGAELRQARTRAGLSLKVVAAKIGRDYSSLSRWESGVHKPNAEDVSAVLVVLGVTGDDRDRILELARHDGLTDWVAPGIGRQLSALIEYERLASGITAVNPLIIPGMLQTREYALAIMLGDGLTRGQAEQRSMFRTGRQSVLQRRKRPPEYVAIIGEHAITHPACGRGEAAEEQLQHLLFMAGHHNCTIHVLPRSDGYSPALEGPFVLLEFDRDRPVVQVDSYHSTSTITHSKSVESYQRAAEKVRRAALGPAESTRFIEKQLERGF